MSVMNTLNKKGPRMELEGTSAKEWQISRKIAIKFIVLSSK
jgi:hypothetical protein